MKILVCNPAHYGIEYEINPWMRVANQSNKDLALRQWVNLVLILQDMCDVVEMPGQPHLPDLVFTANAGVVANGIAVLANFKYPQRQPEKAHYKKWFEDNGFRCLELDNDTYFEGAGDCLANNDDLYFGHGFRSDRKVYEHPLWVQFRRKAYTLKLIDPYFYHLDTCFCPLKDNYALIYPAAFEDAKIEGLKLLPVPKEEAAHFACNAVCVDDKVVIPSGCPETAKMLKDVGFKVRDTDMSEFIKAGGACKCLTLRLDQ